MALPCSGTISLDDVRDEISDPDDIGLGHANSRLLAGIPVGEIKMSDFYCTQDIPDWIEFGGTIPPLNGTEPANHTLYGTVLHDTYGLTPLTTNSSKVVPIFDNSESTYTDLPWNASTIGGVSSGGGNGPKEIFARYIDPMGQPIRFDEYSMRVRFTDHDYWSNGSTQIVHRTYAVPVSGPQSTLQFDPSDTFNMLTYGSISGPSPFNMSTPGIVNNAIATTNGLIDMSSLVQGMDYIYSATNSSNVPNTRVLSTPFYLVYVAQHYSVYGGNDVISGVRLYGSTFTVTAG